MNQTETIPGRIAAPEPTVQISAPAMPKWRELAKALVEVSKPGITRMVTITSLCGFVLAGSTRTWGVSELVIALLACAVGTALSAAGSNALNQWMERERDAAMHRTSRRPIPDGRASAGVILGAGTLMIVAGCGVLAAFSGIVPALVALVCAVSYLAVYTPLKPVTTFATYVGAIPGALPPMIGWTAAAASSQLGVSGQWEALMSPGSVVLFAIMFAWQIPHFLAIAWMHKEDYAKGGYRVLSVVDPTGTTTSVVSALWTVALLALTLTPPLAMPESVGLPYIVVAVVSGFAFAWCVVRQVRERTRGAAKRVFFASIIHMPLVFGALVIEALVRAALR